MEFIGIPEQILECLRICSSPGRSAVQTVVLSVDRLTWFSTQKPFYILQKAALHGDHYFWNLFGGLGTLLLRDLIRGFSVLVASSRWGTRSAVRASAERSYSALKVKSVGKTLVWILLEILFYQEAFDSYNFQCGPNSMAALKKAADFPTCQWSQSDNAVYRWGHRTYRRPRSRLCKAMVTGKESLLPSPTLCFSGSLRALFGWWGTWRVLVANQIVGAAFFLQK